MSRGLVSSVFHTIHPDDEQSILQPLLYVKYHQKKQHLLSWYLTFLLFLLMASLNPDKKNVTQIKDY